MADDDTSQSWLIAETAAMLTWLHYGVTLQNAIYRAHRDWLLSHGVAVRRQPEIDTGLSHAIALTPPIMEQAIETMAQIAFAEHRAVLQQTGVGTEWLLHVIEQTFREGPREDRAWGSLGGQFGLIT